MDPSQYMPQYGGGMFGGMSPFGQQQQQGQQGQGGGFNPLMFLSPMGGLMMSHPNMGLMALSPALGFANLLGAFK